MVSGNGTSLNAGQTRTLPAHLRYAKLSADLPEPEKRTPSQLAAELKGTVQLPVALKRPQVIELLNMSEYTHNVESVVPLDEPLFQPTPPEVVFEAFEPLQKYTALLSLRNNDNVNRRIKIITPDSSVFSIEPPKVLKGSGGGKVAPGMEVLFKVHFAPREGQDYHCQLVCITERERFVIGISARGPRACFDFPDAVDFGLQPVRACAEEVRAVPAAPSTLCGRGTLSSPLRPSSPRPLQPSAALQPLASAALAPAARFAPLAAVGTPAA